MANSSESRITPRVALKVEIAIHSETNFYTGFAMNISTGGLFIATHVPAAVGAKVPVTFTLPNSSRVIEVSGEVVWYRDYNPLYPDTHPGMGLKFADIKEEDAKIINDYISNIREPYFHPGEDE